MAQPTRSHYALRVSYTPNASYAIGVSRLMEGDDADALLKRADARLYDAKTRGRNRVER